MNFLFVVQGEGRGHLTQAISLSGLLERNGHKVVAVLTGKSNRRELPAFYVNHFGDKLRRFRSPNFLPSTPHHHTNIWLSIAYNILLIPQYIGSILFIRRQIAAGEVDAVVNFYELLTGLGMSILPSRKPCYCIAHQYLFLHPEYRFPSASRVELLMLKFFTRVTCLNATRLLALSFRPLTDVPEEKLTVVPPLLRRAIFEAEVSCGDYLHGYMLNDNYADEIMQFHVARPDVSLHFFWDRRDAPETSHIDETLEFHRLNDDLFVRYMAGCLAYATTAGFESVCEALYMGKPVLVVPTHIEQMCNAFEVSQTGVGVQADFFDLERLFEFIPDYRPNHEFRSWITEADTRISSALTSADNLQSVAP
jgi:uncharacterized protein (TIGR00661 family)